MNKFITWFAKYGVWSIFGLSILNFINGEFGDAVFYQLIFWVLFLDRNHE